MTSPIDEFLEQIDEPARDAFAHVIAIARDVVPEAEDGKKYAMPALVYRGKGLLAFARAKQHLGVYPCSGSVIPQLADRLDGFSWADGTLRFQPDKLPADDVITDLVRLRRAEIDS